MNRKKVRRERGPAAGGALGGRDSRFEVGMAWTFGSLWGYLYYMGVSSGCGRWDESRPELRNREAGW